MMSLRTSLLFVSLLAFLLPSTVWAGESIVSKYLQASGGEIKLAITINSPPPTSVIFIQKLPKGINIKKSSPHLKNFNKKRGEAKWLLKHPKPGTIQVSMTLNSPVNADSISGEVRFKDPRSGRMVSMQVRP